MPRPTVTTTHHRRRAAAALVGLALAVGVPMTISSPADAKSCKWVQVSYDPATHTSVWRCTTNRP